MLSPPRVSPFRCALLRATHAGVAQGSSSPGLTWCSSKHLHSPWTRPSRICTCKFVYFYTFHTPSCPPHVLMEKLDLVHLNAPSSPSRTPKWSGTTMAPSFPDGLSPRQRVKSGQKSCTSVHPGWSRGRPRRARIAREVAEGLALRPRERSEPPRGVKHCANTAITSSDRFLLQLQLGLQNYRTLPT